MFNSWLQPGSLVQKNKTQNKQTNKIYIFNSVIHYFIASVNLINYFGQWLEKLGIQILLHISAGKLNWAVPQYSIELVLPIELPVQN